MSLNSGICNFDITEEEALKKARVAMFLAKTAQIKEKIRSNKATALRRDETSEDELFHYLELL